MLRLRALRRQQVRSMCRDAIADGRLARAIMGLNRTRDHLGYPRPCLAPLRTSTSLRPGRDSGPALHRHELAGRCLPLLHANAARGSRCVFGVPSTASSRAKRRPGYEIAKDEYVRFEPEELKALEQASSSALVIDSFVPETAVDPVYFEDTYYLGAGKNGERGYRVLTEAPGELAESRSVRSPGEARRLRSRSACTRTDSSSNGSTSRARSTTRPRSTQAPSRRFATRSGRSPSV